MKFAITLLIALLSLTAQTLRAEDLQATVISVSGNTQYYEGSGSGQALKAGTMLKSGTRIATDQKGLAILLLADGSKLSLGPNTDLTLSEMTKNGESFGNVFNLLRGLIRASVQKLTVGSKFEVTSTHGVAAVKGTEFECEAKDEGMEVRCSEGRVWLSDLRRLKTIEINREMKGSCGKDKVTEPKPMNKEEIRNFGTWANENLPKDTRRDAEDKRFWDSLRPDQKLEAINALRGALGDTWDEITTLKAEEREHRWRERLHGADERKLAGEDAQVDFALRKTMLDRQGRRVRFDEFLIRPSANQLQFLNYTKREDRTDLVNVVNTYNKNLPNSLGDARDINKKVWIQSAPPAWWVRSSTVVFANSGNDSVAGATWFFDPVYLQGVCGCSHWELPVQKIELGLNLPDIARPTLAGSLNIGTTGILLERYERFDNLAAANASPLLGTTSSLGSNSLASGPGAASLAALGSSLRWTGGIGFSAPGSLANVAPVVTGLSAASLGVGPGDLAAGERRTYADGTYLEFRTYAIDENGRVQNLPDLLDKGVFSAYLNLAFKTYQEISWTSNKFKGLGDIDIISQMMWWSTITKRADNL